MSLEEFFEADEEPGYRYELARGVVEVTEVPDDPHGYIVCNLYCALARYNFEHPGRVSRFGGAGEFRLWLPGMISGRNPDVAVVVRGTGPNERGRRPPSLVFEVVSPRSEARDYETKREEYLVYGLREYWIVDRGVQKVTVLVRDGDVWAEHVYGQAQEARSVVLPGFAIRVDELWIEPSEEASEPEA